MKYIILTFWFCVNAEAMLGWFVFCDDVPEYASKTDV
jgi:hypothetical protein